jgi:hypothetical protein
LYKLSYILKQQWCLFVWAVIVIFFQSLPLPCGVFWGGGRESRWSTRRGGQRGEASRGASMNEEGPSEGSSTGALCTKFTLVFSNPAPLISYLLLPSVHWSLRVVGATSKVEALRGGNRYLRLALQFGNVPHLWGSTHS